MVCLLAATCALAQSRASYASVTQDDVTYRVYYNDGYAYVYGIGNSSATDITIADSVTYSGVNYPVTYIAKSAFSNNDVLQSVTIKDGLTQIFYKAFYDCDALKSVVLPSTLDSLATYVFYSCAALEEVVIGEGVTELELSDYCFKYCYALKSIILPEGVTSLGAACFAYCAALESVSLPSTLTSISAQAFLGCEALKSITIPESVTLLPSGCFSGCAALESVSLPSTLTGIESSAFYECEALRSITIPEGVTSVPKSCFNGCDALDSVVVKASTPPSVGTSAFPDEFYHVVVPKGCAEAYYNNSSWSSFTIIDGEQLGLTIDISTPGTLADMVLAQVENFRDVNVLKLTGSPNSTDLSTIQSNLTKLLTLDLGETDLTSLPKSFLEYRNNIEHIVLPANLDTITGGYAFYKCYNLREIEIPGSLAIIPTSTFYNCYRLDSITFNEGLTQIGSCAFSYNDIRHLSFPSTLTTLGQHAFEYCTSLEDISFNVGLRIISSYAFQGATSLKSLSLPSTVTYIGNVAFSGCTALTELNLNEGLAALCYQAFYNCDGLTSLTLPSSLLYCYRPFYNCDNLTSLTCLAAVPPATYGYWPLYNTDEEGKTLYVPSMLINEYKQASGWTSFTNIKTIEGDYEPECIRVINDMLFTSSARPTNTPDLELLSYDWYYDTASALTDEWTAGHMSVENGETFSMGTFAVRARRESYKDDYYDARYPSLVSNTTMRADSVVTGMTIYDNQWFFVSFPYDVQVSDIQPSSDDTQWVVRKYSGANRAAGLTDSTWINMTVDSVLSAGQGYIVMTDGSDTYSTLTFPAINNTNKNNIFACTDQTVELSEYLAEYSHNRSWNLVGNPFPCFYDTRYMDFAAPITVWNGTGYTAYSLTDDSYVLKPYEAFFVQKPVDDSEMTFSVDGRQHTVTAGDGPSESKARAAVKDVERSVVNLTVSQGDNEDRTRVVINEQAEQDYELNCDAAKFMSTSSGVPQLWTIEADGDYAINERPMGEGTVAVGFRAGTGGTHTLTLTTGSMLNVTLNDLYEDVSTPMSGGGSYTFDTPLGTFTDRFTLTFASDETTAIENVESTTLAEVQVIGVDGQLRITAAEGTPLVVYSASGALIGRTTSGNAAYDVAPGVYIVNMGSESRKVIVTK